MFNLARQRTLLKPSDPGPSNGSDQAKLEAARSFIKRHSDLFPAVGISGVGSGFAAGEHDPNVIQAWADRLVALVEATDEMDPETTLVDAADTYRRWLEAWVSSGKGTQSGPTLPL